MDTGFDDPLTLDLFQNSFSGGSQSNMFTLLYNKQKEFLEFVLSKYIEIGVEELDEDKLPSLLELKYQSISDAAEILGDVKGIRATFIEFQKYLYQKRVA